MPDRDPYETQPDVAPAITTELSAAGFDDAHEIGRGGFGVVYRCVQAPLDRAVAVKVLTADFDEENRMRFFREQRAMGRLSGHPNIVNILHVGATDSGRPFIVMQYHPQDSLDTQIRRDGPLRLDDVLSLGVKMAGALETAHRLGIIHRDVKPANILLTDYGAPVLTDFGIAHIAGGFQTATGTVTGSPAFTAPEVLTGDAPSPASDIYGLGATLFCAITGHAAFERHSGEHVVAQFLRISTQPVPDLREQGIADDVAAVIERAMSADPGDRPSTAARFGDELRQVQADNQLNVDDMAVVPGEDEPRRGRNRLAGPPDPKESSSAQPRLPSTSPPVRGSVGELPSDLTSFVGRRRELTEVREKLSISRLVTLIGIGGVGKTRLALRAAADTRRAYRDGVCLVELGELRDPSLLVDTVAAVLGVRNRSSRPLLDVIVDFLASQHFLLVLDNCEHVIDAAARLAERLLRTCPQLRILATSREPLNIGGEIVFNVPTLTVPDTEQPPSLRAASGYDAMTLFTERANVVVPGFELTEDNRVTVARICQKLDGLPLPIELAAARLRAMSSAQILERLNDRYQLLTRGPRGAPTRQQTLRLSVDWSYELCEAREQDLWVRLSVFAGSFELDAAENICAGDSAPAELLDTIASLLDKSILMREQIGAVVRFRMLETLREYGAEKLAQTDQYLTLHRRHRDWYVQLALDAEADWISSRQTEWIARLGREQPNLREAIKFSLAAEEPETETALRIAAGLFFPLWVSHGLLGEGRHWLDDALARQPRRATAERVKALYAASVLAELQGDITAGTALVEQGKVVAAQVSDPMSAALIDHAEGLLALFSGEFHRACDRFTEALASFGARGEMLNVRLEALQSLGWARQLQGDTARAAVCYEQVLGIAESHGESVFRSYSLWGLGVSAWKRGEFVRAYQLVEQGIRLTRVVDDPLIAAADLEVLAWIAYDEHDANRSATLMGAAESLSRSVGSSTVIFPNLSVHHEECERQTRRSLGVRAFESAHQRGKAMRFDEAVAFALSERPRVQASSAGTALNLTKRERQVAELVARGLTNKAIAAQLVISQRTAQGHVEHILVKLGFTSRAQIAAWIAENAHEENM